MATVRRNDAPTRRNGSSARSEGGSAHRPISELADRKLPCDLEAEMHLLGSIVLLPDVLDEVILIVRPDDFFDDGHQKLYTHLSELHEASRRIDLTILSDRLKSAGDFEAVGGAAYMGRVINSVPNAAHAVYYAEIVQAKSTFRSMILAATEIVRNTYDETREAPQLLNEAEHKIFSILDDRSNNKVVPLSTIVQEAMARLDARMKGTHIGSCGNYGFTELDAKTAGLHEGELIILAARPGMGKTAFAMNVAENVATQDIPVLFVSLEMSSIELSDRLLCSAARVNAHRLRNGTMSTDDRMKLVETSMQISKLPLFIDDSPSRTISEIAAAARRLKRKQGSLGLIVIDYLQLIEPDNPTDPRQEQVAKIARRLKGLAREVKVPVLCLAQLNRQTEAGRENIPKLSHLRESGAIEQDADVVLFVHREEYFHHGEDRDKVRGQAQLHIAKQRNGPAGEAIELCWLRDFTRFQDPVPDHLKDFDDFNSRQMVDPSAGF